LRWPQNGRNRKNIEFSDGWMVSLAPARGANKINDLAESQKSTKID
jgi:hypothetical protein